MHGQNNLIQHDPLEKKQKPLSKFIFKKVIDYIVMLLFLH